MNKHGYEDYVEVDQHFSTAVDGLPEAVGTERNAAARRLGGY